MPETLPWPMTAARPSTSMRRDAPIHVVLISTMIAVTLATLAAYAIARIRFPGKRALFAAALAIVMFPQISIVGPLFDMWRDLGLFNTWPG